MSMFPAVDFGDRFVAGAVLVFMAVSIISALALLIARFLRRQPPLRHTILASALICCLATPLIAFGLRSSGTSTFSLSLLTAAESENSNLGSLEPDASLTVWLDSMFRGPEQTTTVALLPRKNTPREAADPISERQPRDPATLSHGAGQANATNAVRDEGAVRRWLSVAIVVWLAGFVFLFTQVVWNSIRVWMLKRASQPLNVHSWKTCLNEIRRRLALKRIPPILESDRIQSPVAAGIWRKVIILPSGLAAKIKGAQLCDVLTHECAHVLRHDPLILSLQAMAGCLFWPIPLVHWMNRQLSRTCEEICDNYVLDYRDPLQYAETLVHIATFVRRGRWPAGTVGILQWRGELESRVASLIDEARSTLTRGPRFGAIVCLTPFLLAAIAVCGITVRAAQAEPTTAEASASATTTELDRPSRTEISTSSASAGAEANGDARPPGAPANEGEPIRIQVWWGVSGLLGDQFLKQVDRFNASQQKIAVETGLVKGYAGVDQHLQIGFETGDLPDAAIVEIHSIASLAAGQQIEPLDEFIKRDPKFDQDDLLPGMLANLHYKEKLYALPINRSTPILYYNKDRFAEAGLDPDKPPETWQEVQRISRLLTSDDQSKYGYLAVGFPWIFESLVWSSGGELIDGKRATFAGPGSKTLQLWADMVHRDKSARFGPRRSESREFIQGRAAMVVESTALLHWYPSAANFQVGTAPLPRFEGFANAVPTGGGAAVVPAKISAERKAAVWEFLTWLIDTQQTAEWSRATGYIPVRKSAVSLLRSNGFYDHRPEFETAIDQLQFVREAPQVPQWPAAWPIVADAMSSIVRDNAPALETLQDAEEQVDALLDERL